MRGRGATAAILTVLAMLAFAGNASACTCAPQPAEESLREADAAIVGRLAEVLPRGPLHASYRYEVRRVYSGGPAIERGETLTVRSSRGAAACALPQRTDRNYGLFLSSRGGRWFGGICGVIKPRQLWLAAQGRSSSAACGAAGTSSPPSGSPPAA